MIAVFVVVIMTVMIVVVVVFLLAATGTVRLLCQDLHIRLDRLGDTDQLRQKLIGVLCGDPQLLGGEYDAGLLHLGQRVDFVFDFGCAVGAAQVLKIIGFMFHNCSFRETHEQVFI